MTTYSLRATSELAPPGGTMRIERGVAHPRVID
jgi:hypothetical protein